MGLLYVAIGLTVLVVILMMFLFIKSFRFMNPSNKASTPKLIKSFLFIYFTPSLLLSVWAFFFGLNNQLLIKCLATVIFLTIWFGWLKQHLNLKLKNTFLLLLVYAFFSFFTVSFLRFFVNPYSIPSGAMEDTLQVGDYLLSDQFYYGHSFFNQTSRYFQSHKPQRGDVIVFLYPGDKTKDYVKRCIGIPGDVVEIKNKDLYVNGIKQNESYVKHIDPTTYSKGELSVDRDFFGPVTVDACHYFMLGDNRDNSADSRYWGQLDEKLIKGKASLIYLAGKDHRLNIREIH